MNVLQFAVRYETEHGTFLAPSTFATRREAFLDAKRLELALPDHYPGRIAIRAYPVAVLVESAS